MRIRSTLRVDKEGNRWAWRRDREWTEKTDREEEREKDSNLQLHEPSSTH